MVTMAMAWILIDEHGGTETRRAMALILIEHGGTETRRATAWILTLIDILIFTIQIPNTKHNVFHYSFLTIHYHALLAKNT